MAEPGGVSAETEIEAACSDGLSARAVTAIYKTLPESEQGAATFFVLMKVLKQQDTRAYQFRRIAAQSYSSILLWGAFGLLFARSYTLDVGGMVAGAVVAALLGAVGPAVAIRALR